ncbi:MAG: hypothetical protein HY266_05080 [Deltaproteobacteria bacterium]|nr:hypothetical protein [Deltaproteobacteria bacterium]
MTETTHGLSEQEKEALKFLERDFNQCFQQMRHYDSQIFDIFKFMFTGYITLIGATLGFYKFGLEKNINLNFPVIAVLSIGLVFGLFILAYTVSNRVYFVRIFRYINEQRKTFLSYEPLGFANKSEMYIKYSQPAFFNWISSQAFFIYIIAFLNSTLLGALLFIIFASNTCKWVIITPSCLALFIVQLIVAIYHLKSRENKSIIKADFTK